MKFKIPIIFSITLLLLVVVVYRFYFHPQLLQELSLKPNARIENRLPEPISTGNHNLKVYENTRYGYTIQYPTSWNEKSESDNGDGKVIYFDSKNNKITVYARLNPSNFSIQDDPVVKDIFLLADGKKATSLYISDNGKVKFLVYLTSRSVGEGLDAQFVFYLSGSEQFFKQNEKVIRQVASTLSIK